MCFILLFTCWFVYMCFPSFAKSERYFRKICRQQTNQRPSPSVQWDDYSNIAMSACCWINQKTEKSQMWDFLVNNAAFVWNMNNSPYNQRVLKIQTVSSGYIFWNTFKRNNFHGCGHHYFHGQIFTHQKIFQKALTNRSLVLLKR